MIKKLNAMIAVALISEALCGTAALGEYPENGKGKHFLKNHPGWFLQKMDANRDGKVTMEEWHQGWENLFNQVDTRKDGFLDRQEVKAFAEKIRAEGGPGERFAKMDKNQDGKISRDEWMGPAGLFKKLDRNGDGAIVKEELPNPEREDVQSRLKKMDTNGDGKISQEEWKGPAEVFSKIDTNQDGFLASEEFQAFHQKTGEGGVGPGSMHHLLAQFYWIDQNKDGKISPDELDAWAHQLFLKLDQNQDGVLDPSDKPQLGSGKPSSEGPRARKHLGK